MSTRLGMDDRGLLHPQLKYMTIAKGPSMSGDGQCTGQTHKAGPPPLISQTGKSSSEELRLAQVTEAVTGRARTNTRASASQPRVLR